MILEAEEVAGTQSPTFPSVLLDSWLGRGLVGPGAGAAEIAAGAAAAPAEEALASRPVLVANARVAAMITAAIEPFVITFIRSIGWSPIPYRFWSEHTEGVASVRRALG